MKSNVRLVGALILANATLPNLEAQQPARATDFPEAIVAETRTLEFHVAQPTTGSLQEQVRAGLAELVRKNDNATLVKLRVFARVSALDAVRASVRRALADMKTPLPALALVGVAGFPDSTQLVEIESTAHRGRASNPNGLAFIAGLASPTGDRTIAGLARVAKEAGVPSENVSRISCFYERPDQAAPARNAIAATFPQAEASFVFSYATSAQPLIECEAMARLAVRPSHNVEYFNLPGMTASPNYSHAALVAVPSLVFTGTQTVGASDAALEAGFARISAAVARVGARLDHIVMGDSYWLSESARDRFRVVRAKYFNGTVPAATGVFFAGLSPADAVAALETVVILPQTGGGDVTLLSANIPTSRRYATP